VEQPEQTIPTAAAGANEFESFKKTTNETPHVQQILTPAERRTSTLIINRVSTFIEYLRFGSAEAPRVDQQKTKEKIRETTWKFENKFKEDLK